MYINQKIKFENKIILNLRVIDIFNAWIQLSNLKELNLIERYNPAQIQNKKIKERKVLDQYGLLVVEVL